MLKTHPFIWMILLFIASLGACSQDKNTDILFKNPGYSFPYDLNKPDRSWKMPNSLVEISGLSWIDHQRLACVQDEKAVIFIFNLDAGKVENTVPFSDDGDYEGIEIISNDAWVLKSNGTLFKVSDFLKMQGAGVKKIPTALSGKNDTEGLAYDPVNKNLLIACKEQPFADEAKGSGFRAVYSFNPESSLLETNPFLLINLDSIRLYKSDGNFKPSGIAIQPKTGNIFIMAAAGNLLLVYSAKGEMLAMIKLRPNVFPKPEGICFSPDGTLFIANEGNGGQGTILEFNYLLLSP
jgi:uncharacterized protein YjiK